MTKPIWVGLDLSEDELEVLKQRFIDAVRSGGRMCIEPMSAPGLEAPAAPAVPDGATPGPWFVRRREVNGELRDCFVAAPDCQGLAYDASILCDDEYHDGVGRKLADCELIVAAVNQHRATLAAAPQAPAAPAEAQRLADFLKAMRTRLGSCRDACGDEASIQAWDDYERAWTALLSQAAPAAPSGVVGDMAALVKQLVQALRKAAPNHALPAKALDYLRRQDLLGSLLRLAPDEPTISHEAFPLPTKAITASLLLDDGGDAPAYCLMVAYRSEREARAALALLSAAPAVDALEEARRTIAAIGIVGHYNEQDVILRTSVLGMLDRRIAEARAAAKGA